jgi:uncharacterized protein with WD repeat
MAKTDSKMLIWKGGGPYPGWPASDHEEPDSEVYQAKLASGLYRTPDSQEDANLEAERRAAKALANAQAAKAAQEAAQRAQEASDKAQREAADRKAAAEARLAAARATLKEVDRGES